MITIEIKAQKIVIVHKIYGSLRAQHMLPRFYALHVGNNI